MYYQTHPLYDDDAKQHYTELQPCKNLGQKKTTPFGVVGLWGNKPNQ
jgi:hypothetical protein